MNPNSKSYELRVYYSSVPGDDCYVAHVVKMPGIMAHGDTAEEAITEVQSALAFALEVAKKENIDIPSAGNASAASLGRAGGSKRSPAKSKAAKKNGAKGGRPKKVLV